jgi:hypothetical protein
MLLLTMHDRDCNANNIMMDASSLYPSSWHAVKTDRTPDLKKKASHYTRTQRPVRYYLIDLGIARRYDDRADATSEPIIMGGDKSPPEHQGDAYECDPFPTDVYFVGNMIRQHFLEVRRLSTRKFSFLSLCRKSSGLSLCHLSSKIWFIRIRPLDR